jgi:hypothetical protein
MKSIVLILALVLLTGCTQALQVIDKGADLDIQTMQGFRVSVPKYIEAWPLFSGLFKGSLGSQRAVLLSSEVLDAWDELDAMAARWKAGEKLTDEELGYFYTTKFHRFLTPTVQAILQKYVPPAVWAQFIKLIGL